jgi:phosphatidylserine decarboxylase
LDTVSLPQQGGKWVAKALKEWLSTDIRWALQRPRRWLSEQYFFRDPARPQYVDSSYFFAPADGVILYQREVEKDRPLVELKGRSYSLREALRDNSFDAPCLVVGIFMTIYDVHVNRVPYSGRLRFKALPAIETHNRPMLAVEEALLQGRPECLNNSDYLFSNQRMLSSVYSPALGQTYYLLQIADYDVSCIMPFDLRQGQPYVQNQRFSQIRFGSQVDLIIPQSSRWRFDTLLPDTTHVEAGLDPLVRITPKGSHEICANNRSPAGGTHGR